MRGWRCAIDRDETMSCSRPELFKACAEISWRGDVRALWKALDADDSGITTLEELDMEGATALAHFKAFLDNKFGSACAGFKAFDHLDLKKLREREFVEACKIHGFAKSGLRQLFSYLDWQNEKAIFEVDFNFLDIWRPPAYLIAVPNEAAANEFRRLFLKREGTYLLGYRRLLDTDGSNRVSWREFYNACNVLGFSGDAPGAWRSMDDDCMGAISLRKIDQESNEAIMVFKRWTDDVFGGIKSAFSVLSTDGRDKLSYREFRAACRAYRFPGDAIALFESLDMDMSNSLSIAELAFLDNWETEGIHYNYKPPSTPSTVHSFYMGNQSSGVKRAAFASSVTEYRTAGPGPGAYDMPQTWGARQQFPCTKHNGSFSFRSKLTKSGNPSLKLTQRTVTANGLMSIAPTEVPGPSPAQYNVLNGIKKLQSKSKPRCFFGSSGRGTPPAIRSLRRDAPGPGAYDLGSTLAGPGCSMKSRKQNPCHPLDNPGGARLRSTHMVMDGRTRRII